MSLSGDEDQTGDSLLARILSVFRKPLRFLPRFLYRHQQVPSPQDTHSLQESSTDSSCRALADNLEAMLAVDGPAFALRELAKKEAKLEEGKGADARSPFLQALVQVGFRTMLIILLY